MNFKRDIEEECPICMDVVEGLNNRVTTDCGHTFHCSCLMQNAAHNGFGCPYCRTMMAEEPKDEDDEDNEDDEWITDDESDEDEVFDNNALTSFRMFHQHLAGEEIEESGSDSDSETEQQEEELEEGEIVEDEDGEEEDRMPDAAYVTQKLIERNVTMEDLVKHVLWDSQTNFFGEDYNEYRGRSNEVYGQFRAIISRFRRLDTMRETIREIREPIRESLRETVREEEVV